MKFPTIPEKLDKRKKLMRADIIEMQELRNQGFNTSYLSKKYKISNSLVCYHTNGDDYKEAWLKKCRKRQIELMKTEEGREKHREYDSANKHYKRKIQLEAYREYIKKNNINWYHASPENAKKHIRKARLWEKKNPDKVQAREEIYKVRRKELYKLKEKQKKCKHIWVFLWSEKKGKTFKVSRDGLVCKKCKFKTVKVWQVTDI